MAFHPLLSSNPFPPLATLIAPFAEEEAGGARQHAKVRVACAQVDMKMDDRRKSRREERIQEQLNKFRAVRPKLQHQFTDLKRDLQV